MQKIQNKTLITIALILMITMTSLMTAMPLTSAQNYVEYATYTEAITSPSMLVGVGQPVIVHYRIDKLYPVYTIGGKFWMFTMKITSPDNTTELKTNLYDDATGGGWFYFTPAMTGTYKFQTIFDGQWINATTPFRYYKPSVSAVHELTVQTDPIPKYSGSPPLPTDYWSRPINGENKGWGNIGGDWLMIGYDRPAR